MVAKNGWFREQKKDKNGILKWMDVLYVNGQIKNKHVVKSGIPVPAKKEEPIIKPTKDSKFLQNVIQTVGGSIETPGYGRHEMPINKNYWTIETPKGKSNELYTDMAYYGLDNFEKEFKSIQLKGPPEALKGEMNEAQTMFASIFYPITSPTGKYFSTNFTVKELPEKWELSDSWRTGIITIPKVK